MTTEAATTAESDRLHARVCAFIRASMEGGAAEPFDELALAVARFQAAHVPAVGRLVRARGVDLAEAKGADVIPALPCDVFRLARVAVHAALSDRRVFRTSGTSQGAEARGEHAMRTTATYELGALAWGRRMLWPDRSRLRAIVVGPPPTEAPDSSLSFMLGLFAEALGGPASFHLRGGALSIEGAAQACAEAREAGDATIVLGASFAFVHLLEGAAGLDFSLPPGSRAMQTGGFKGRSREVAPEELRAQIAELFGVPTGFIVGEYGMTELSSQAYDETLAAAVGMSVGEEPPAVERAAEKESSTICAKPRHGVYLTPPWMRASAVDPTSLLPVPEGEVGIARIVDLANVDSAVAIQTSDQARVFAGGRRVELLGRAPGAAPRGCSIAIDEILSAERE